MAGQQCGPDAGRRGVDGLAAAARGMGGGQFDSQLVTELKCQVETLQEEVLHLRQFSMALIRSLLFPRLGLRAEGLGLGGL